MPGGLRLLIALFLFTGVAVLMTTIAGAQDAPSPSGPPKAKVAPVEDTVQGHKIVDPYRYLENPNNPDTKLFVEQEMAYTRSLLDPLPGRDKINARLTQLLAIGTVGAPHMGGKYYFYTRRDAGQNQPVLYVRDEACKGEDRVLSTSINCLPTAPSRSTGGIPPKTASMSPMAPRPAVPRRARST